MHKTSHLRLLRCLILAGAALFSSHAFCWHPESNLVLSRDEAEWRRSHPIIRVGVFAGDHMPFEAWRGGQPDGMAVDYARMLAGRAGMQLEFHPYANWNTASLGSDPAARFDLLLTQPVRPDRMGRFLMLRPYAFTAPAVIMRSSVRTKVGKVDLSRATIVVERRFSIQAREVQAELPEARLVFADQADDAMSMVASGAVDAYVVPTWVRARALVSRRPTPDLMLRGDIQLPVYGIAPAVRRDLPLLAQILKRSESSISVRELDELRARWGADDASRLAVSRKKFSKQESGVLQSLSVLRIGYEVDRYPYSFNNNVGQFDGIAADYLRILQTELDLKLQFVPAKDWTDLQRMVTAGRVDVIVAGTSNDFSPEVVRFSQPYEYFPEVIVTRLRGPAVVSATDLAGQVVAVRSETGVVELLRAQFEDSHIVPVPSNEAGLELVDQGRAAAFVGTLPAIDALIRNRYAGQLHIVGPAGFDQDLAFGVRTDYERLLPLFDDVLASMQERDKQAIRARWLTSQYQYGVSLRWVAAITAGAILVLGTILFAYFRLRSAVRAQQVAERGLANQLAFQQALLETIPYAVFVKDSEGKYLAVNRAYECQVGSPRSDLLGRTMVETRHLPLHDIDDLFAIENSVMAKGESIRRELRLPDATNGHLRTMILWMHPFRESMLHGVSLLGTLVDVTEIREAEARARTSEQRLTDITSAMPGTVFQIRQDHNQRVEFTYLAGDVEGLLGTHADRLLGDQAHFLAKVHEDDRPAFVEALYRSYHEMKPWGPLDMRFQVREDWRWLRAEGGQPRALPDYGVEWSGYWIDTTQAHLQAEALLVAKAQAEAAASAKSAFLATMSHEIRTPMAGVLGLVELMGRTPLDREQKQMLDMANDSAQAMLQILDDILDYSRIEAGRLSITHAAFDPRTLLDSVAGLFSAKVREKSLKLYLVSDWRVAGQLMGDSVRIRQILTNLISNAVKFTEQGSITVTMSLVDHKRTNQVISFAVEDTGIGIERESLKRLFQPFVQAEQSTTRRFGGTGLGLAISRRLASLMGGDLVLESTPHLGTRATFALSFEVAEPLLASDQTNGRLVWLGCGNPKRVPELSNSLSALGFTVIESIDGSCVGEFDDLALIVVDADVAEAYKVREANVPVILIDESLAGSQMEVTSDGVLLACNPVLWHVLGDACMTAMGRREVTVPMSAPLPDHGWKGMILVAEDHPTNRAVIARQLEAMGYDYSLVEDGQQALDAMAAIDFDLLITDCHMPYLDGYALTRRIRGRESREGHLPIIALSASALPEQVQRCVDAGMDAFLAKPVQFEQLKEKLEHFLPRSVGCYALFEQSVGAPPEAEDLDKPSQMMALSQASNPIAQLCRDFGSQKAGRDLARQLILTTHEDLKMLSALPFSAGQARRDLLHRIEGALRIVKLPEVEPMVPVLFQDSSAREDQIRKRLMRLEGFLSSYEADH
ncbi:ATP-binding protein [Pseudoxanthomonas indica]|uniref:ATP-binding protein n=1 Tax=Pseudoxanthomonas indica TaxID=428993 RepID=UPI0015927326|nr:transporter substrate-binding domain-containing protein [Pseudoxanthomonas indica]